MRCGEWEIVLGTVGVIDITLENGSMKTRLGHLEDDKVWLDE